MQRRGRFLSIEGIDGSGKTTTINRLAEAIEADGYDLLILREPGGTAVGERVRSILLDEAHAGMDGLCELFLFAAARAELTAKVIRPKLDAGSVVICDRFIDSTVAYQGYGRGVDREQIQRINEVATGGLKPDRTFLLDLDPAVASKRLAGRTDQAQDRLDQEDMNFRRSVREGYLALADSEPERIVRIDANRSTDEVVSEILKVLREDWEV